MNAARILAALLLLLLLAGTAQAQDLSAFAYEHKSWMAFHRLTVALLGFGAILLWRARPEAGRAAAFLAWAALAYAGAVSALSAIPSVPAILVTLLAIGALAAIALAGPARSGSPPRHLLFALLAAGALAGTSFLEFHDGRYAGGTTPAAERFGALNMNDMFHFYLGSKYFPELGYGGLYDCAALAAGTPEEANAVSPPAAVRDLASGDVGPASAAIARAQAGCRGRFSEARWQEFAADVAFFFRAVDAPARERYLTDQGFNNTPVWIALSGPLVADTSPNRTLLGALALVDLALVLGAVALMRWGFGSFGATLFAFTWGVGLIWVYDHVGLPGSFGRLWWMALLTASLAALARRRPTLAGGALGLAILLGVFPLAFLLLPGLVLLGRLATGRGLERDAGSLVAAALATVAIAGGLALLILPIPQAVAGTLADFLANAHRYGSQAYSNQIGFTTLLRLPPALLDLAQGGFAALAQELGGRLGGALRLLLLAVWLAAALWSVAREWAGAPATAFWRGGMISCFALFSLANYGYASLVLGAALLAEGEIASLAALMLLVVAGDFFAWRLPGADVPLYWLDSLLILVYLSHGAFLRRRETPAPI